MKNLNLYYWSEPTRTLVGWPRGLAPLGWVAKQRGAKPLLLDVD
ncbi:hypothetical protein [Spiroplasma endosymbiont of Tiphia femorata]